MTFRNTALLFFIFLLLNSCKGLQYYKSGTNPAGVSIILKCPSVFYTNIDSSGVVTVSVINHNSKEIVLSNWWNDIRIIGTSRFYNKEVTALLPVFDKKMEPKTIGPNDTLLLYSFSLSSLLNTGTSWNYKDKISKSPHIISKKKNHPYIYISLEGSVKVPNQDQVIKIRSDKQKVVISTWKEQNLKSKKTELGISTDVRVYNLKDKTGQLICKIKNTGAYPIPLFNDPGSVRFKVYAYNSNRTAIMFTQYVLDNGKLPVSPVNIEVNKDHIIGIPLNLLLFTESPPNPVYYWSWNKKIPPTSPLVYGKKDIAMDVEFWFGIVVDGKEYLSNTIVLPIEPGNRKNTKTRK